MDCDLPGLLCPWDSPGKNRRSRSELPFPSPGDLPNPGIKPAMQESACNAGDPLPTEL